MPMPIFGNWTIILEWREFYTFAYSYTKLNPKSFQIWIGNKTRLTNLRLTQLF